MRAPSLRIGLGLAVALAATVAPLRAQLAQPGNGLSAAKALDHDAYDIWNRVQGQALADDGRHVLYHIVAEKFDTRLHVHPVRGGQRIEIERAENARFSDDGRFVVFRIKPSKAAVEEAKKKKTKPEDMPKDSLGILDLSNGQVVARVAQLKSFAMPEEAGGWLAYQVEKPKPATKPDSAKAEETPAAEAGRPAAQDSAKKPERKKDEGSPLVVRNLATGEERRIEDVASFRFSKDGRALAYFVSTKAGDTDGAFRLELAAGTTTPLLSGKGDYKGLAFDEAGRQTVFLSNAADYAADAPAYTVYVANGAAAARVVATAGSAGIPVGWWVSENETPSFSDNGRRVFFGTAPRPEPKDTTQGETPADEKVVLDIWAWTDPLLQPMQLRQLDQEKRRTWQAVVHLDNGRVVQLADRDVPDIQRVAKGNAGFVIGRSNLPYQKEISWGESGTDYYTIDIVTGEKTKVAEYIRGAAQVSPGGKYLAWFDGAERHWFVMDLATKQAVNVSANLPHPVYNELHDSPSEPGSYGSAGWTTNDARFLVYDAHDVWAIDPTGREAPRSITEGVGRRESLRFRYVDLEARGAFAGFGGFGGFGRSDEPIDPTKDLTLSAFHQWTKADGFYRDRVQGNAEPVRLAMADVSFGRPVKAEKADVVLLTRATFRDFPDLYLTDPTFASLERISTANPQQAEYRWGTSELVDWRSVNGERLQGVLYKPDGFDATKQYPLMVYFYERLSDNLHNHVVPSAGGSSVNISFYVSRGYLVFTPDIPYRVGYPGESAMNAVVPGVLELVDRGFVDPKRIGVQGHSWGGYQISYMITKTNLFAAAEAGAPVSNMISAYGGIRWSSGMSRMFQYEKTQSRLGGSLWEAPMRFIENSPIFWADKVETPLLMMHNDQDGAVPWYQGIEYFVALRRLDKPVWMLNYNGEDHGLRKEQNRKDWAIRMQQFFDHYLMDAPPPVWMVEGVPAIRKGETLGLELVETPKKVTTQETGGRH